MIRRVIPSEERNLLPLNAPDCFACARNGRMEEVDENKITHNINNYFKSGVVLDASWIARKAVDPTIVFPVEQ